MRKPYTQKTVIDRFKEIHGDIYDYSKVQFNTVHNKITVICRIHGEFSCLPKNHINAKSGCPECGKIKAHKPFMKTTETFIKESRLVHGTRYNYAKTVYNGVNKPLIVTCPLHGDFTTTPNTHTIKGCLCPSCARIERTGNCGFKTSKPAILYLIEIYNGLAFKIGITNRTVLERYSLEEIQKFTSYAEIPFSIGLQALQAEQSILSKYKKFKYTGTKLLKFGNSELLTIDLTNYLKDNYDKYKCIL